MKKIRAARLSQWFFLLLFLLLFTQTEYRGSDEIFLAVNSFLRADPLVLISYVLATKTFTWLLLPALFVLVSTLLLGRFFCGWLCPLGTILDLITPLIKKTTPLPFLKGNLKYWLLFPLLAAALFNVNLAGLLDPISILIRAGTFFFYPLFGNAIKQGWAGLYNLMGDSRDYLAPGYALLRDYLLPFRDTFYPLAFLSALIFFLIILLERYERRNWCRNLCPLGTLLGIAGSFSLFKRLPACLCEDCRACATLCPTSFDQELMQEAACIRCLTCFSSCRRKRVAFSLAPSANTGPRYFLERRLLIGGLVSGFFLSGFFRFRFPWANERLLRPPGVTDEKVFLEKCVRCGECIKVCLRSALYPAVHQAGLEGLYTPVLIPRLGYCEYNCTLCGQVCPTSAIPRLPTREKRRAVIGKAVFDKNHCLPFARKINCIVCEEHCPIPQKAIRSEVLEETDMTGKKLLLKKPYVVNELCNGCGICENVCPLEGKAGIEVFAVTDRTALPEPARAAGKSAAPAGQPTYPY